MATAYVVLVEVYQCAEPDPCRYIHVCRQQHQHTLKRAWEFHSNLTTKLGTAHGHLARIAKKVRNYALTAGAAYTGDAKIMRIDSEQLHPVWSDAEMAAFKLGGLEAVKRLQKGIAAEAKAEERARGRALAESIKAKVRAERAAARKAKAA